MHFLEELKKWLAEITEIALLLIALGITFEILFGFEGVPFFGGITTNITTLLILLIRKERYCQRLKEVFPKTKKLPLTGLIVFLSTAAPIPSVLVPLGFLRKKSIS